MALPLNSLRGHMGIFANRLVKQRMQEQGISSVDTQFFLTHFSHNAGLSHEALEELVRDDGFSVAYDGMDLVIGP